MRDSPELTTCMLRKGDFMVWSSTTPHLTLRFFDQPTAIWPTEIWPTEIRHGRYIGPSPDFSCLVKPEHEPRLHA